MKLIPFLTFITILLPILIFAQETNPPLDWKMALSDPDANYYEIVNAAMAHFELYPDDPDRKKFDRWNYFWKDRHSNEEKPGSFQPAYEELYKILNGESTIAVCGHSPEGFNDWVSLGPWVLPPDEAASNGMGIVTKVLLDPNDSSGNTLYASTNASGIWKTTNGQDSAHLVFWTSVSEKSRIPALGVQDLAITSKGYVFAATGYESRFNNQYGVGLVVDKGNGWEATPMTISPNDLKRTFSVAAFNFRDTTKADYILGSLPNEVYISRDEGETFEQVYAFLPASEKHIDRRDIIDLTFHPTNPDIFYAVLADLGHQYDGSVLLRFAYDPATGKYDRKELSGKDLSLNLPSNQFIPRIDLSTIPSEPDWLYAAIPVLKEKGIKGSKGSVSSEGFYVAKSEDSGLTWAIINDTPDKSISGREMNDFEVGPLTENYAVKGGVRLWSTNNLSEPFTILNNTYSNSSILHPDVRDVELKVISDPKNSGQQIEILLLGHDGGVARSYDLGETWEDISTGLNIAQFYGFSVAADDSYLVGGCQDLSFLWYKDGEWRNPQLYGDGGETAIDPYNPNYVYAHNSRAYAVSDKDRFPGSFKSPKNVPSPFFDTARPHRMKFQENGYLYVCTDQLYRKHTVKKDWEKVGSFTGSAHNALGLSAYNSNVAYVSGGWWPYGAKNYIPNQFHRTLNANDSTAVQWTSISEYCCPLNLAEIIDIAVDPSDADKVWIALNHFHEGKKVFYTDRGGIPKSGSVTCDFDASSTGEDSGGLWKNVSEGLPNFPVNRLIHWEGTTDALFAATDVGVYFNPHAADPKSTWQCLNAGLPSCIIMDMEWNACEGKLYAATYGRGIWVLNLPDPETIAGITVKPRTISQNTEWERGSIHVLNTDLVVKSNISLTIKGTVFLTTEKRIMLEPGAQLLIDGGELKGLCARGWGGIHVLE